jgi:geranylgeranyl diphosphate synthase type II
MNALSSSNLAGFFATGMPLPANLEPRLEEALRHVLENPGSLVRPRIVLQVSLAFGLGESHASDLAIALEYFHTASLLFDDLPCMDNGLERRGVPCAHLEFGEAGAILAALALINRAYALAWKAVSSCSQQCQSHALAYLEQRLGVAGLLNGQSLDLHYSALPHDRETTERIAYGKTVSLIRLTLVLPAVMGGATPRELQLLERMAIFWGLSYQILDDLKDVLQSAEETGKTVARDLSLDRPNLALVIGVPGAIERLARLIGLGDRALRNLMMARPTLSFLSTLRRDLEREASRVTLRGLRMAEPTSSFAARLRSALKEEAGRITQDGCAITTQRAS